MIVAFSLLVAAGVSDGEQFHQRAQPGVAGDDPGRRADARGDRRRARPSVGFAASLHGILVTGFIVHDKLPIPLAVLLVLGAGALIGLVNGLIVTKLRVNSVIATLGTGTIITGLAFAYSAGRADRRRRAGGVPPAVARALALGDPEQHRDHGGGDGGALATRRAHRARARRSRRSAATPTRRGCRGSMSIGSRSSASSSPAAARR